MALHPLNRMLLAAGMALALGCSKAPDEPERARPAASAEAVAPLVWDAPGSWTRLDAPPSGPRKAAYRVEKVGNDTEGAEVVVVTYGTGSKGDPGPVVKEWIAQFDGSPEATRGDFEVRGMKVETIEVAGTYKVALTPNARGRKQPPVQMVKKGYRLYGAVVKTPDRGNWFFRLTGPDETVQSARSALRGMLESVR